MDKLLPIGSVVLLKGGRKRVMIYGRRQIQAESEKVWDYIACLYPEGNIGSDYTYVFDHKSIKKVFFIGFQDYEEIEYKKIIGETNEEDEVDNIDEKDGSDYMTSMPEFMEIEEKIVKEATKPDTMEENQDLQIDTLISSFVSDSSHHNMDISKDKADATDAGADVLNDILNLDMNSNKKE